jgi:hypothetical protein
LVSWCEIAPLKRQNPKTRIEKWGRVFYISAPLYTGCMIKCARFYKQYHFSGGCQEAIANNNCELYF